MALKVGDKATINVNNPKHTPFHEGDVVTIMQFHDGSVEVESINGVTWWVAAEDLDAYVDLPRGEMNIGPIAEINCDCGGYAMYKSMAPQYHSYVLPCKSLKSKI